MRLYKNLGMPMTREQCKAQIESIQGASGWMICEKCVDLLGLSPADKAVAREAAKRWRKDKNALPHMPAQEGGQRNKKPAYVMVFGNGFTPTQDQARLTIAAWVDKVKGALGAIRFEGDVRWELRERPAAPRAEFVKVVAEIREQHQGQATDDLLWFDQKTGKDMALVAVWAPEDSPYVRQLLSKGSPATAPISAAPAAPPAAKAPHRLITCCPGCKAKYEIRESQIGKRTHCRRCGAGFEIALAGGLPAVGRASGDHPRSVQATAGDDRKEISNPCVCHVCAHCGVEMESPAGTAERFVMCPSCIGQGTIPAVPKNLLDLGRSGKGSVLLIVLDHFPEKPDLLEGQLPTLMERCVHKVQEGVVSRFKGRLGQTYGVSWNPRTRFVWFAWPLADPTSREEIKNITRKLWQDETTGSSLDEHVRAVECERPGKATVDQDQFNNRDRRKYPDLVLFLTERAPRDDAVFLAHAFKAACPGVVGVEINVKVQVVGGSFRDETCIWTRALAAAAQSGFELDRIAHCTFTTPDGVNTTAVSIHRKK